MWLFCCNMFCASSEYDFCAWFHFLNLRCLLAHAEASASSLSLTTQLRKSCLRWSASGSPCLGLRSMLSSCSDVSRGSECRQWQWRLSYLDAYSSCIQYNELATQYSCYVWYIVLLTVQRRHRLGVKWFKNAKSHKLATNKPKWGTHVHMHSRKTC